MTREGIAFFIILALILFTVAGHLEFQNWEVAPMVRGECRPKREDVVFSTSPTLVNPTRTLIASDFEISDNVMVGSATDCFNLTDSLTILYYGDSTKSRRIK